MAQSGYTPIQLYYSTTSGASGVPSAGNLTNGELAINITDGKLFYKDNGGSIQVIGTKGGVGSSSTTQVLYNVAGLVVGSSSLTFDGTKLTVGGLNNSALTASQAIFTDSSKNLVSNAITGTGNVVMSTSPTLVTPVLGTPTSVTLTNATGLPVSTGISGLGTGAATALGINVGVAGAFVVSGGALGTPSSGTLTNTTGLPLTTGVTGQLPIANGGTGQATASAAFNALSPITTTGDIILGNGTNSATRLGIGLNGYVLTSNGTTASWAASTGGVSSFQTSLSGLTPSSSSTGAITLAGTLGVASGGTGATTLTGIIKGSGTSAFTAATAGTDYLAPPSGTSILKAASGGALANAVAGTDYQAPITLTTTGTSGAATFVGNTLNIPQYSGGGGGSGTVTSVAQSFTGGLISVAGSPITTSGTLALTVAGTSGGIPYFSSGTTWATSAALTANALMIGGGAGLAPATIATGTGVVTALGVNTGTAGAFVVNGGALGTPTSGTLTNCTFPTLNQNTTGTAAGLSATLAVASGGTGLTATPTNGQIDIGNGTGFTRTTLTAGSNVTITNGAGSITIAASGGGTAGPIAESYQTISSNYSLTSGSNGFSVGPVSVATGVAVTVPTGQVWLIAA